MISPLSMIFPGEGNAIGVALSTLRSEFLAPGFETEKLARTRPDPSSFRYEALLRRAFISAVEVTTVQKGYQSNSFWTIAIENLFNLKVPVSVRAEPEMLDIY